jgi:type III secretion protein Q
VDSLPETPRIGDHNCKTGEDELPPTRINSSVSDLSVYASTIPSKNTQEIFNIVCNQLHLTTVDPLSALISRTFCDERLALHFFHCGGIEDLQVEPFETLPAWRDLAIFKLLFHVESDSFTALVGMDLSDYPLLAAAVAPPEQESATPGRYETGILSAATQPKTSAVAELRKAIIYALMEPAITIFIKCGIKACEIIDACRHSAPGFYRDYIGLILSCRINEHIIKLVVYVDSQISLLSKLASLASPSVIESFDLPGRLIIGVKRLTYDTLDALAPGDVLLRALFPSFDASLLDATYDPEDSQHSPSAVATWGTSGYKSVYVRVQVRQKSLEIARNPIMSDVDDPEDWEMNPDTHPPDDPVQVGDLELPVVLQLDILKMSLNQISSMQRGYVIELDTPVSSAQLRLVTHGQTIGFAELVSVGEHLGVRILRMAGRYATTT